MQSLKHFNQSLNEGKLQKIWQTDKYAVTKVGKNKIEFVGDKKKRPDDQVYKIMKDGEQIGTFQYDEDSYSYWVTIPGRSGQKSFDTIDDMVTAIEKGKLNESEEVNEMLGFKDNDDDIFVSNPFFDQTGRTLIDPNKYKKFKGSDLQKAIDAAEAFIKSYNHWKNNSISQEDENGKYNEDAMYLDFYLLKNKKNLETLLKLAK